MSDSTFDVTKNYKRICYREDRDLLNTELNEMQDCASHDRTMIIDRILAPGTILSGLEATAAGNDVTITDGFVYIDGCAVHVPGAVLSFLDPGEHIIYVDVFKRDVTASEDPTLVNPLTGEPTAEREKWIATLQARDTSDDPLPQGARSRSVAPLHIFNRDTGEVKPAAGGSGDGGSIVSDFASHVGHGGLDRHPGATEDLAGFMTPEQVSTVADHGTHITSIEGALPNKASVSDVTAVSNSLGVHKSSGDHDDRYYTKTGADDRYAPKSHVGSGGTAQHPAATGSTAGFMSAADKTQLGDHQSRITTIEGTLPNKANASDVTAVSNALNTHKSSSDHDGRYYTKTLSDGRYTPIAHVESGGSAHALATIAQAGFIPKEVYECLTRLNFWVCRYDYGNDGAGAMPYSMVSGRDGMIWKGRCDSNSTHIILTVLRSVGSPITALFEFYHMVGTVSMQTGSRISLADPGSYPPTVPGGKTYLVDLEPDTFTNIVINVSGSGEVGFALRIFPGDDRQICFDLDPDRAGKAIVV